MAALTAAREEHGKYFEMIQLHPRRLVGTKVPAVGNEPGQDREGFITLADETDAKSWQDAVKTVLVEDVTSRAAVIADTSRGALDVLHSSIEMFQKNADLHPKSKTFDKELADALAATLKPYELRKDGKLQGYGVPTQPLIDQLRAQLRVSRAAAPAPQGAAQGAAQQAAAGVTGDGPQAGVASKAGTSGNSGSDEADVLFGTFSHQTGSYTF